MSVDLGKRKKIRAGHRAFTKKLLDNANELLLNFDGSQSHEDRIEQLIVKYQEKLTTLKELDDGIILLVADKQIEKEIEESEAVRSEIHEVLVKLKRCLASKNKDGEQVSSGSPSVIVNSASSSVASTSSVSSPKLPKLTLNKFNGDPKRWQEWWECFKVAIDENNKLSDIEKFTYLRSLVEGSAESAIAGLPLTSANYKEAVEILQNRFAQKQIIINSHMDALLNLEPVRSMENIKATRKVVDSVETHVRGLKALGIDSKQYGALLVPILMDKLPAEIRLIISRKHKDNFELSELVEAAKSEIEARERCRITHSDSSKDNKAEGNRKPRFPQSTGSALLNGEGQTRPLKCLFCERNHRASDCTYVTKIDDRKAHLRKQGRCFVCLRRGDHIARDCKVKIECSECNGRHHKAVCAKLCKSLEKPKDKDKDNGLNGENTSAAVHVNTGTQVFLQTAQVTVTNPNSLSGDEVKIRALFDTGAQRSYLSKRVADKLGLETVQTDNLVIATFGAEKQQVRAVNLVNLTVRKAETRFETNVNVYVVPKICSDLKSQDIESAKKMYPHLNGIEFADCEAKGGAMEIDLLIGSDYMWDFLNDEKIRGESGQPVAISTKVGWLLSGPVEARSKEKLSSINFQSTHVLRVASESPKEDLDKLWDLDSIGIRERGSVQEEFEQNIDFKDGRYFVNLPWREHHELLPDNYENCVLRLKSTVKRLKKQPEVLKEYNSVIEDQERWGIIEKVDTSTIPEVGKVHYLPHHGVVRQQALSTKLRVVFDASSKAAPDLPSLNECLHVGPALSPKIFDILVRFRQQKIAIVADIEKAFLNIGVEEIDRDVLRFLWIDDIERDNPDLLIYRFCRVVFGVNASPFLLNATLQNHIRHYNMDSDFAKKLLESFYVDDLVSGEKNDEEAFAFCQRSKECLSKGGFHLRKWVSNSKELLDRIQDNRVKCEIDEGQESKVVEDTETYAKTTVGNLEELQETDEHKVLGLQWNCKTDKLCIGFDGVLDGVEELTPTKRIVLKVAARLYDPLGFVSPVIVLMKMLLQEICARNLDWDSPLPGDLENKWKHWLRSLRQAKYVMISRCLYAGVQEEIQSCSLHGFGDASKGAYCAVVYMLVHTSIGSYVRLIASKTRVAPNKNYTIPRLELLSGLILARLVSAVREALGQQVVLDKIHLWLDSITAVYWITGKKEWKQFVQNRVDEILRLTVREMWHHCPGETNPADIGSRGELPETLKGNELWWSGPKWLSEPESSWPSSDVLTECPTDECMMEARKKQVSDSVEKTQVTLTVDNNVLNLEEIIDPKTYSDSEHLFRVTAWVLRFVHNLKSRIDISTEEQIYKTELLNCEISKAESLWLKTVQKTVRSERNYRQIEHDLGLFEDDDGVLRCDGRIANAEISEEAKFPALIPKNCLLVELLIRSSHKRVYHCKVSSTLAELRTRYWIPSGRQVVKKVLSKCCICRRYEGASYRGPPKVNLPKCRLSQKPAFSYVGIDFAGPLYIKDSKDSNMQKAYIALFSCCSSRALHLELTTDLSAETFIRCLRRFTSRRGVPELIISDNAKTFKAAKKLLNKIFNHPSVRRFCTNKRIGWRFNVDRAPWWGGFFERMVQEVKRCLRKTLRNAKLNYDELHTVLVEIEGTLNSRPLTYVSSDEIDDPITPSHLVVGRRISSIPIVSSAKVEEVDDSSSGVEARRNYLRKMLTHFWTRWSREYVADLRARDRMKRRAGNLIISTGDVVTVHEDGQPRGLWRLGKVESLIPGKDGEIRAAVVRVRSRKGRTTLLKRPIQKLFPLELFSERRNDEPVQRNGEPGKQNDEPVQENIGGRRRRRAAALDADYIRRLIDQ